MSYYKILGLEAEPFSTSPDPGFFYETKGHKAALFRLRIAVGLRRGLSAVLGDVGVGKTTLSRRLSQLLSEEPAVLLKVILNPDYHSEQEMLEEIVERFNISPEPVVGREVRTLDYMKWIEKFLFEKSITQKQTVVLLIDEAQKLSDPCLEVLRSLLNYETNEYKTLQVILMGQMELLPRIQQIKNLWDRISLKHLLKPLEEDEVKKMIEFRLQQAGYQGRKPLFTDEAFESIFHFTQGYPRKIAMICHDALEYLLMYNKESVDLEAVRMIIRDAW
ncbi:MAG: AAA family ATPase [Candidatus Omnitrophota bacterium]